MDTQARDSAGVKVPPLIYLAGLIIGFLAGRWLPNFSAPVSVRLAENGTCPAALSGLGPRKSAYRPFEVSLHFSGKPCLSGVPSGKAAIANANYHRDCTAVYSCPKWSSSS
jgi:hypothetical protein